MTSAAPEPKWSRILSLSVHEFRTPMTVVAGYIRMLLKERAGALNDQQRRLLEEAEKSCVRLSGLLTEMSDLSNLEAGTAPFNRSSIDLRPLLAEAIAALPETPGRDIAVTRELTKLHEEVLRGSAEAIAATLSARPAVKGEITLIAGPPTQDDTVTEQVLAGAIAEALASMPASKAASEIARRFNLDRSQIYQRILDMKSADGA